MQYRGGADLTVAQAVDRIGAELERLGARGVVLSTNVPTRLDGWPRSGEREPEDPGVAVYFTIDRRDHALACDKWNRVAHNIAAVAKHVEALRGIERWGVGTTAQAFAGYAALPPAAAIDWRIVLEVPATATLADVEARFRELARSAHPDVGGSHVDMSRLTVARAAARAELEGRRESMA